MTELRQVNKQDFLQELKYRVESEEVTKEEIISLMRNYLLKEEEENKTNISNNKHICPKELKMQKKEASTVTCAEVSNMIVGTGKEK